MSQITKAEFDALPESLKTEFTADGDSYTLKREDVEGLRTSRNNILAEKKILAQEVEELRKFKVEMEQNKSQADEDKMKAAGEFAELEKKLRAKIAELETTHADEMAATLAVVKTERLKNELQKHGILPDRVKYAQADLGEAVELVKGENGFELKVKGGIGDAGEFEKLVGEMKERTPFFFAANTAAGSGASGNGNTNGSAQAQVWSRAQWDSATTAQRVAFSKDGGRIQN